MNCKPNVGAAYTGQTSSSDLIRDEQPLAWSRSETEEMRKEKKTTPTSMMTIATISSAADWAVMSPATQFSVC